MKRTKQIDPFLGNAIHLISKNFTKGNIPLSYYKVQKPPKGEKNDMFGLWVYHKGKYYKLALADITKGIKPTQKGKRIRTKNGTKKRTVKRRRLG